MHLRSRFPIRFLAAALLAASASLTTGGTAAAAESAAAAATSSPLTRGLIVKLKDDVTAVRHDLRGSAQPAAEQRAERLKKVLGSAGFREGSEGRSRLLGGKLQVIDFIQPRSAEETEALAARLRASPQVAWVVPNEREQRLQVPGDPLYAATASDPGQWWLFSAGGSNANALADRRRGVPGLPAAWSLLASSSTPTTPSLLNAPSAVVAVLDTGITAHPDLDANILPGRDFVSVVEYANDGDGWDADPSDPGDGVTAADRQANPALFGNCAEGDSSWHGSIIAGMLGAVTDNGEGVAGLSWQGRVLPVRVAGKCGAEVADIVAGMRWAAGLTVFDHNNQPLPLNPNPARVINISFGGRSACNAAYQEAIDEVRAAGAIVVAAAGNGGGDLLRPASCDGVVGVVALNRDGFKSYYSNFGAKAALATVGGDPRELGNWGVWLGDDGLLTLSNGGQQSPGAPIYGYAAGSSFAAPIVAGVASLMLTLNPDLSAAQLVAGLRLSARPHVLVPGMPACSAQYHGRCQCDSATCGAGILDAEQALLYARDPASYVPPARGAEVIGGSDFSAALQTGPDERSTTDTGTSTNTGSGGGGGGSLSLGWLLLLALSVAMTWKLRIKPLPRRA